MATRLNRGHVRRRAGAIVCFRFLCMVRKKAMAIPPSSLKVRRGETILIDDFTDSAWMTAIGLAFQGW
jgi:hypothetical protein